MLFRRPRCDEQLFWCCFKRFFLLFLNMRRVLHSITTTIKIQKRERSAHEQTKNFFRWSINKDFFRASRPFFPALVIARSSRTKQQQRGIRHWIEKPSSNSTSSSSSESSTKPYTKNFLIYSSARSLSPPPHPPSSSSSHREWACCAVEARGTL